MDSIKGEKTDQSVFTKLIKNETSIQKPVPPIKLNVLDPHKFVPGHYYFDETWRKQNPDVKLVALFINDVVFRYPKIERLKDLKKWFISR